MLQDGRKEANHTWWMLLLLLEAHFELSTPQMTTFSTLTKIYNSDQTTYGVTTEKTTHDMPDYDDSESFLTTSSMEETTASNTNQVFHENFTNSLESNTQISFNQTDVIKDDRQIGNNSSVINSNNLTEMIERIESAAALVPIFKTKCLNTSQSSRGKGTNETYLNQSEDVGVVCSEQSLQNTTKIAANGAAYLMDQELYGSIAWACVGFVVMILNGLVVATCKDKNLRRNTYLNLVLGLSVNDFNLGLTTFVYGIQLIFRLLGSLELCVAITVMALSCLTISIYQSLCISLHRYLVISMSEWRKILFKKKRKYIVCLTGWAILIGSFASLVSPTSYDNNLCYHAVVYGGNMVVSRWFYTITTGTLMFSTLFFYSLAMYNLKIRHLSMSASFEKSACTRSKYEKGINTSKKIIDSMKLVSILLLALYLFSGPLAVLTMIDISHEEYKEIFFIAFSFAVLNSMVNPIIYYINIEEFQQNLKNLFCNAPNDGRNSVKET